MKSFLNFAIQKISFAEKFVSTKKSKNSPKWMTAYALLLGGLYGTLLLLGYNFFKVYFFEMHLVYPTLFYSTWLFVACVMVASLVLGCTMNPWPGKVSVVVLSVAYYLSIPTFISLITGLLGMGALGEEIVFITLVFVPSLFVSIPLIAFVAAVMAWTLSPPEQYLGKKKIPATALATGLFVGIVIYASVFFITVS